MDIKDLDNNLNKLRKKINTPVPDAATLLAHFQDNPFDIRDIIQEQYKLFRNSGIKDHFIYAWLKTGRMITVINKKMVSKQNLDAWKEAMDEYDALKRANFAIDWDALIERLIQEEANLGVC